MEAENSLETFILLNANEKMRELEDLEMAFDNMEIAVEKVPAKTPAKARTKRRKERLHPCPVCKKSFFRVPSHMAKSHKSEMSNVG